MLCEKNMTTRKARSALSIPQSTKNATLMKTRSNTRKTNKHCTNCGMMNHNVGTCIKKKEETMVTTKEASQPSQKPQKTSSYGATFVV